MTTHLLSKEVQKIVTAAQQLAGRRKDPELDSAHLFYSFLKEAQRDSTDRSQETQTLMGTWLEEFDICLEQWYPDEASYYEPSARYLKVLHESQKLAENDQSGQIDPRHLYNAIIQCDNRVAEWVSDHESTEVKHRLITTPTEMPLLEMLGRNLTQLARAGKLPKIIGRENEIRELTETLLQHGKNSALLLGPPGTGKTAIVEQLAQLITSEQMPAKLEHKQLIELNLANLVAGTSFRGEFEERLQTLLHEIERNQEIILVIDEFHTVAGTGKTVEGGPDAANILKPALARGELTCIGISTPDDYTRHIEQDTALLRRFQIIRVDEPTETETLEILREASATYSAYHRVKIPDELLKIIITQASHYLSARYFPDKALDVLRRACSRTEIEGRTDLSEDLVMAVMSDITGVPVGNLNQETHKSLMQLEESLGKHVIGQAEAIKTVVQTLRIGYAGLRDPHRPRGIFLFVGPSGVGKTELAKAVARVLFGKEEALIRLDMSEYAERLNVSRLIGSAPGYVGYEEGGQLTQALRDHPHTVVLLDEIEKAHPEVFDLFLQLFDEGRLTDARGNRIDGRHAIFIMTSNLGNHPGIKRSFGFNYDRNPTDIPPQQIEAEKAIRSFFRPEFINRLDHIIHFRTLDDDDLVQIAEMQLEVIADRLQEQKIRLTYDSALADIIVAKADTNAGGARHIQRVIEQQISVPVSEMLMETSSLQQSWIHLEIYDEQIYIGRM